MLPRLFLFGLGNPGARYRNTRHNLGFVALDTLASRHRAVWRREATFDCAAFDLGDATLSLIKPNTFVNLSGNAVRDYAAGAALEPAELLVLVDDISLPLGQLRLRRRGSDGGHNGLRSIIAALGSTEFPRLRMGVGPVPADVDPADFVLSPFEAEEKARAVELVERAARCIEDLVSRGFERAMSLYNAANDRESD